MEFAIKKCDIFTLLSLACVSKEYNNIVKKYLCTERKNEYDIVRIPWNLRTRIKKACRILSIDIIQFILDKFETKGKRELSNICSYYFYINGHTKLAFQYNYNVEHILYAAAFVDDLQMILDLNIDELKPLCIAAGYAAEGGHISTMIFLTNLCGFEPLDIMLFGASKGGHIDIVKYCLDRGATSIYQAANCAAQRGHIEIIEYLANNDKGSSELIWNNVLFEVVKLKHTQKIIELSIKNGNLSMESLRKAMIIAIYYNKLENLSILQQYFTAD